LRKSPANPYNGASRRTLPTSTSPGVFAHALVQIADVQKTIRKIAFDICHVPSLGPYLTALQDRFDSRKKDRFFSRRQQATLAGDKLRLRQKQNPV
jgi:hypothetical protein